VNPERRYTKVVNLATAKALDLIIPETVKATSNEVIE
jgi:hypothetical protein